MKNEESKTEQMTIQIRISLPEVGRWRVYKFARQYPFLAVALGLLSLMALVLLGDGVGWVWHMLHSGGAK